MAVTQDIVHIPATGESALDVAPALLSVDPSGSRFRRMGPKIVGSAGRRSPRQRQCCFLQLVTTIWQRKEKIYNNDHHLATFLHDVNWS